MSYLSTDLIKNESIEQMVFTYERVIKEIEESIKRILAAKDDFEKGFGEQRIHLFNQRNFHVGECSLEAVKDDVTRSAWRILVNKVGIYRLVSCKKRSEIDHTLSEGKLPALTVENIKGWVEQLLSDIPNMLDEAIKEVFDFLRPGWRMGEYKTNSQYEIGKRAIVHWFYCDKWSRWSRLNYHLEKEVTAMDNVFHMLDGKGPTKYPGDLLTKIRDAERTDLHEIETEYFKAKWCKNGNCHLEFKRLDLLARLNAVAGGKNLKHDTEANRQEG